MVRRQTAAAAAAAVAAVLFVGVLQVVVALKDATPVTGQEDTSLGIGGIVGSLSTGITIAQAIGNTRMVNAIRAAGLDANNKAKLMVFKVQDKQVPVPVLNLMPLKTFNLVTSNVRFHVQFGSVKNMKGRPMGNNEGNVNNTLGFHMQVDQQYLDESIATPLREALLADITAEQAAARRRLEFAGPRRATENPMPQLDESAMTHNSLMPEIIAERNRRHKKLREESRIWQKILS